MDPSYTNSVGATNPGGTNPGNLNAQNTNLNAQVLQGGQQNPAQPVMPQQPMQPTAMQQPMQPTPMMQQPVISSGTDDVVIGGGNADSGKKSRKGVVILIILIVLLALVGGGFLLWQNGVFGGGGGGNVQTSQMTDLQKSYNSYVNYVLWGVESDGKPDYDAMEQARPYFEGLSENELTAYVSKANGKYETLKQAYDSSTGEKKISLEPMKLYFEDFARIKISEEDIINKYLADGQEMTNNLIEKSYEEGIKNEKLAGYSEANKKYMDNYLQMVINANGKGCIKNKELIIGCYALSREANAELEESRYAMLDKKMEVKISAVSTMNKLYVEFYGDSSSDNSQNSGGGE